MAVLRTGFTQAHNPPPLPQAPEKTKLLADNPHDLALLSRIYNEVYVPSFPIEEERDDYEGVMSYITTETPNCRTFILAYGDDLDDPDPAKAALKGFVMGSYFERSSTGYAFYLGVAPEYRKEGIGKKLMETLTGEIARHAESRNRRLEGMFAEVNDPAKVSPDQDSMPPVQRALFYDRLGWKKIPIDYTQPAYQNAFTDSALPETPDMMMLLCAPLNTDNTTRYATRQATEDFLRDYYTMCHPERYADLDNAPAFTAMKQDLVTWDGKSLSSPSGTPAEKPALPLPSPNFMR